MHVARATASRGEKTLGQSGSKCIKAIDQNRKRFTIDAFFPMAGKVFEPHLIVDDKFHSDFTMDEYTDVKNKFEGSVSTTSKGVQTAESFKDALGHLETQPSTRLAACTAKFIKSVATCFAFPYRQSFTMSTGIISSDCSDMFLDKWQARQ